MIEIRGLSGGYQKEIIIEEVNLDILEGDFFALIGPNGSGKSTFFKLVTGILPQESGTVEVCGRSIYDYSAKEKAQLMAVLSQDSYVEFDFTVEEIVMLGRYPHQTGFIKYETRRDREIVGNVMRQTNIEHYRFHRFKALSGGEKQRVLLAKALAQEPRVLFLDEPTNHLDIKHTVEMLHHLKLHQKEKQMTIIAILHDLNTAALFADRIGVLHNGRLVETGGISTLKNESLLELVYEVDIKQQSHPIMASPQVMASPPSTKDGQAFPYEFELHQNNHLIHLSFTKSLRTLSNSVIGEGFQWVRNFCNFHVDKTYNCSDPITDMVNWLRDASISEYDTVGMMTAVNLNDYVLVKESGSGFNVMAVVTAGVGNAVDITKAAVLGERKIGTVNIMVFLNGNLTDGAFVNAIQSATEAKTKALADLKVLDGATNTIATGTSTDSIVIASTQTGDATPYAGSGTVIGRAIGTSVYKAVFESIQAYEIRRTQSNELV
ncbi:adenosylcobinamide amidohydrolase [Bacillus sp. CGMCC 1.16607]|uniref:adenosylcobinamide amidohydrolase n=1 Tax=Bacillus sp. CGMCC 1.16607 TaxID=3351842 RepID=UPI003632D88B